MCENNEINCIYEKVKWRLNYWSIAYCKTAVTPLLTHWSYCSLALSHRDDILASSLWCKNTWIVPARSARCPLRGYFMLPDYEHDAASKNEGTKYALKSSPWLARLIKDSRTLYQCVRRLCNVGFDCDPTFDIGENTNLGHKVMNMVSGFTTLYTIRSVHPHIDIVSVWLIRLLRKP